MPGSGAVGRRCRNQQTSPEALQPFFVGLRPDLENADGDLGVDRERARGWIAIKENLGLECDGNSGENLVTAGARANPFADRLNAVGTDLAEEGEGFDDARMTLHVRRPGLMDETFEERIPLAGSWIVFGPEKRE